MRGVAQPAGSFVLTNDPASNVNYVVVTVQVVGP
jgi:hypothetical protein